MIKSKIIGLLIVVAALVILIAPMLTGNNSPTGLFEKRNKVECSAGLNGLLLGDPSLDGISCKKIGTCINTDLSPLSLLRAEGTLKFDSGDDSVIESVSIPRQLGTEIVKGELCTNSPSITIKLYNTDGDLIGTKIATVIQ